MLTGGFVPQVASFVTVGNAEGQVSFNGKVINGRSMGTWYGMYIATPAWKEFMNTYLAAANIQPDNSYGNPDARFTGGVQPQQSAPMQQRQMTRGVGVQEPESEELTSEATQSVQAAD